MSNIAINMSGGSSVKLLTAGKYCDKNIVVTASGGGSAEPVEIIPAGNYTFTDADGSGSVFWLNPDTYPNIQPSAWAQVGHIYQIVIDGTVHNAVCDNAYNPYNYTAYTGVFFGESSYGIEIAPETFFGNGTVVWQFYSESFSFTEKTVNIAVYDITPSA